MGVVGFVGTASASSHREAPAIANDAAADNTDLWAWHEGDAATGTLHVVAGYIPLQEPSGGPNYPKFSDDVLYEIHVARGSSSLDDVVTYQVKFTTAPLTKVDPADLAKPLGGGKEFYAQLAGSYAQTYSVTQVIAGKATVLVSGAEVPLPSIGPRTQVVGLMIGADKPAYEAYALSKVKAIDFGGSPGKVWAGQRDDGFYVDLAGTFDLANFHVADNLFGGGPPAKDNVAGYNCHAISIDIPFAAIPKVADAADKYKDRLGVWASASRRKVKILRNDGSEQWAGPWTQVSRMGMPLVNELIIGLQDKDKYNRTRPAGDVANFAGYILNPVIVRDAEAVGLYAALTAKLGYPAVDTACNGASCESGRVDIVGALNIGAADFPLTSSGDVIRVDPTLGAAGFPNGRPLPDGSVTNIENDVTDVMASIALYGFPTGLAGGPGAFCNGTPCKLGDGVNHNDTNYPGSFPYLATPWRGWDEGHGGAQLDDHPRAVVAQRGGGSFLLATAPALTHSGPSCFRGT